jgi:hypothetical protein
MFVGSTAADLKIGSNRVKAVRQGANLRYFRPDSLSGLEAWWDAADASTITFDGERVSAIADKSGNDRSLTNATTGATQPSYAEDAQANRNALRFTAANATFLQAASKADFDFIHKGAEDADIFIAGRFGDTADPDDFYFFLSTGVLSSGVGFTAYYDDRSEIKRDSFAAVVRRGATGTAAAAVAVAGDSGTAQGNEANLCSVALKPSLGTAAGRMVVYTNGRGENSTNTETDSYSAATSSGLLTLGKAPNASGSEVQGDIYEVVIYKGGLTTDQRQLVEGYLAHKWGLQSKLPYDHPYASSFYGVQTLPTDTDVLAFAAASGAVSIPDLLKIEDLVAYLKAQSLWDYARFYPMKSAQNAGSGSTVYGLGGLTSNNMTLVNSPTWGSDGVTFASASSQYGTISDFMGGGTVSMWWSGAWDSGSSAIGQYDYGLSQRSTQLAIESGNARLVRSLDGGAVNIEQYIGTTSISGNVTLSAEWIDGGGRSCWIEKAPETLSISAGSSQTGRFNTSVNATLMCNLNSNSPANFSSGTAVFAGFIETALTTTQRETITDLINAL